MPGLQMEFGPHEAAHFTAFRADEVRMVVETPPRFVADFEGLAWRSRVQAAASPSE